MNKNNAIIIPTLILVVSGLILLVVTDFYDCYLSPNSKRCNKALTEQSPTNSTGKGNNITNISGSTKKLEEKKNSKNRLQENISTSRPFLSRGRADNPEDQ